MAEQEKSEIGVRQAFKQLGGAFYRAPGKFVDNRKASLKTWKETEFDPKIKNDKQMLETSKKQIRGNWGGLILLAVLSIIIIAYSINEIKKLEKLSPKVKEDEESQKTFSRNKKMNYFSAGFGSGSLLFCLLTKFINPFRIMILGLVLVIFSSITINSFQNVSKHEICAKEVEKTYNLMYGFLGAGIGMIFGGISMLIMNKFGTEQVEEPVDPDKYEYKLSLNSYLVLGIFFMIYLIILSSFNLSITSIIKEEEDKTWDTLNIVSISIGIIYIMFVIGIMVRNRLKKKEKLVKYTEVYNKDANKPSEPVSPSDNEPWPRPGAPPPSSARPADAANAKTAAKVEALAAKTRTVAKLRALAAKTKAAVKTRAAANARAEEAQRAKATEFAPVKLMSDEELSETPIDDFVIDF